jgi:hypothetical protein
MERLSQSCPIDRQRKPCCRVVTAMDSAGYKITWPRNGKYHDAPWRLVEGASIVDSHWHIFISGKDDGRKGRRVLEFLPHNDTCGIQGDKQSPWSIRRESVRDDTAPGHPYARAHQHRGAKPSTHSAPLRPNEAEPQHLDLVTTVHNAAHTCYNYPCQCRRRKFLLESKLHRTHTDSPNSASMRSLSFFSESSPSLCTPTMTISMSFSLLYVGLLKII